MILRACLLFILIVGSVPVSASTYYVSSLAGDDNNDGQSMASPFQSIEHLNGMSFAAGDSVLFQSGG